MCYTLVYLGICNNSSPSRQANSNYLISKKRSWSTMYPSNKRWQVAPLISQEAADTLNDYPPILRQILFNRGYATQENARQYLEAQMPPETNA